MNCNSDEETGLPGSPPDMSLTDSKSSKSSSFHSYQSENSIQNDAANFEDIGLDDDSTERDLVVELPNPYTMKRPIRQRELTGRPAFPSLRGQVSSATDGLVPSRKAFTASTPSLGRMRSPSPAMISPLSARSATRRGSWQSNRDRKTTEELEKECDEEDGDDVPDDCLLENVPISPRPRNERTVSMPAPKKKKPAGNGTPPFPVAQGSLKSPRTSNGFPPRAKSWTAALGDLSEEAKALTEALEAHSDERRTEQPKRRVKSHQLPLRKNDNMIDPLPISKEKEKFLSRTRPSWLPPKDPVEERRHLREYQRMMELSLVAERKRAKDVRTTATCKDDTASSLLKIWEDHVLPNWDVTNQKRTRELWWRGVAPRSRGEVWQRAAGNQLGLTEGSYIAALSRSKSAVDVGGVYPELKIFQPGGPLHSSLVNVLKAYIVYRSDVGYIDGMATIAALLLLNLPSPSSTFITLANLLNRPLPLSFHTGDIGAMQRVQRLVMETLQGKFPRLYTHLCRIGIEIDFSALFTQMLDLDCVTRLWDVWVFEGDAVLVRAMVALFGCSEGKLYGAKNSVEAASLLSLDGHCKEEDWMRAVRDAGRDRKLDNV